jgi:very-short-patch-repair endonuclease
MAAVLAGGEGSLLSYRSAGSLWRILPTIDGPVHVTVSGHRQRQPGIVFHRMRSAGADERTELRGIPVTSIARTLLDLATRVGPRDLRNAFEDAERLKLLHRADLARVCEHTTGRRGTGVLRALLASRSLPFAETRSGLERTFLRYCRDRALPIPAVNVPLAGYLVDCLWRNQRGAVVLDSWAYHGDRESFEADRRRDAHIQRVGHRIVRVTMRRIALEADDLEDELCALLGLAKRT